MQTICIHFNVVEVDLNFSSDDIPVELDLIDLIHRVVGPHQTDIG